MVKECIGLMKLIQNIHKEESSKAKLMVVSMKEICPMEVGHKACE